MNNCIYTKESETLQIPYSEYLALMEQVQYAHRLHKAKSAVLTDLQQFLGGNPVVETKPAMGEEAPMAQPLEEEPEPEKVSVEYDSAQEEAIVEVEVDPEVPAAPEVQARPVDAQPRAMVEDMDVPPIKKDIGMYFNDIDESGRLFNVLKQYYTCLNDSCGGTVRVTMKDGVCSLWNYDEWEEFAFVDVFEGHLRIALDPHYTEELDAFSFCEVPRLLSSRRNLVSVKVDDLNNTMLDILAKAFKEVGLPTR